jgi:hypothetical protein
VEEKISELFCPYEGKKFTDNENHRTRGAVGAAGSGVGGTAADGAGVAVPGATTDAGGYAN